MARGRVVPARRIHRDQPNQHSKNIVKFYNGRGTAEQWIKKGKNAVKWTKLSCRTFKVNQTRLQLFALAYNLANFLRRLALPHDVEHWSLTTQREKLVKIGAEVIRKLFAAILDRIERLALPPPDVNGRILAQESPRGRKTLALGGKVCAQRVRSPAKELEGA